MIHRTASSRYYDNCRKRQQQLLNQRPAMTASVASVTSGNAWLKRRRNKETARSILFRLIRSRMPYLLCPPDLTSHPVRPIYLPVDLKARIHCFLCCHYCCWMVVLFGDRRDSFVIVSSVHSSPSAINVTTIVLLLASCRHCHPARHC